MLEGHERNQNFHNSLRVVIIAQYLGETHLQPNYNFSYIYKVGYKLWSNVLLFSLQIEFYL